MSTQSEAAAVVGQFSLTTTETKVLKISEKSNIPIQQNATESQAGWIIMFNFLKIPKEI